MVLLQALNVPVPSTAGASTLLLGDGVTWTGFSPENIGAPHQRPKDAPSSRHRRVAATRSSASLLMKALLAEVQCLCGDYPPRITN